MTNSQELRIEMLRHNDTGGMLAKVLGIAHPTFSNKLNNKEGAEFTQKEISLIKDRYNLSSERVDIIFFGKEVP